MWSGKHVRKYLIHIRSGCDSNMMWTIQSILLFFPPMLPIIFFKNGIPSPVSWWFSKCSRHVFTKDFDFSLTNCQLKVLSMFVKIRCSTYVCFRLHPLFFFHFYISSGSCYLRSESRKTIIIELRWVLNGSFEHQLSLIKLFIC